VLPYDQYLLGPSIFSDAHDHFEVSPLCGQSTEMQEPNSKRGNPSSANMRHTPER